MSPSFGKGWGFFVWMRSHKSTRVQPLGHENREAPRREAERYQKAREAILTFSEALNAYSVGEPEG